MFFFFYLARHMKFENRNSYLPLRAREEMISTGNKGSVYLSNTHFDYKRLIFLFICFTEMEVGKHSLLILQFKWKYMHPSTLHSQVSAQNLFVYSDRTDSFTCTNYARQSVVSLNLGYHLKMEVWVVHHD